MGSVLTTDSSIKCASAPTPPGTPSPSVPLHGGSVAKAGTSKLKVNGISVLLKSGIGPNVSDCHTANNPPTTIPCTSATITAGEATKLKVGGSVVMLVDLLMGTTVGTPPGILSADANQTKLTAI